MTHANFVFGESDGRCVHCVSRTVLVSFYGIASVDQEPFEDGEDAKDSPEAKHGIEIPDSVEVADEITGHYCIRCNCLTSLCINPPRRQKYSKLAPRSKPRTSACRQRRDQERAIKMAKRKVKITAFVSCVETRIIEVDDDEMRELSDGDCGKIIEEAMWCDRGTFVESSTNSVDADEWEVISPKAATTKDDR